MKSRPANQQFCMKKYQIPSSSVAVQYFVSREEYAGRRVKFAYRAVPSHTTDFTLIIHRGRPTYIYQLFLLCNVCSMQILFPYYSAIPSPSGVDHAINYEGRCVKMIRNHMRARIICTLRKRCVIFPRYAADTITKEHKFMPSCSPIQYNFKKFV